MASLMPALWGRMLAGRLGELFSGKGIEQCHEKLCTQTELQAVGNEHFLFGQRHAGFRISPCLRCESYS